MLKKWWNQMEELQNARSKDFKNEAVKIERKIGLLLDRVVDAETTAVVKAYENRIQALEGSRRVLLEKKGKIVTPVQDYPTTYRTAIDFISNPYKLWASGRLENRRAVLKLVFGEHLTFVRGEGYRTAKTTLPFRQLGDFFSSKNTLVEAGRVELPSVSSQPSALHA